MSTVGRKLAEQIKAQDGYYHDDPRVMRIVEYDNAWGSVGYGLEYARDLGRYARSEFVRNPRVFWEVK